MHNCCAFPPNEKSSLDTLSIGHLVIVRMGCGQSKLNEEALDGLDASRNGRKIDLKKPVEESDEGGDVNGKAGTVEDTDEVK
mmetsp:Transcript_24895/g.37835  ORF Transcript_24895/g.37835 Transcript_24895/m.37835 type:complete len:82 (-) Transcript_24895:1889-2134(-)